MSVAYSVVPDVIVIPGGDVVACVSCGFHYDAMSAEWCRCVNKDFATACPQCQSCVCKSDQRHAVRDFWFFAPDALLRRRADEKERRKAAAAQGTSAVLRALIVDDDEEIRLITEHALQEMGFATTTSSHPAEALEIATRQRPQLVITDALMPGGDGRELCKRIKLWNRGVKVIVMTSLYTSPRYASEAYRYFQADGYLAKPIDFHRLENVIRRLVPKSGEGQR